MQPRGRYVARHTRRYLERRDLVVATRRPRRWVPLTLAALMLAGLGTGAIAGAVVTQQRAPRAPSAAFAPVALPATATSLPAAELVTAEATVADFWPADAPATTSVPAPAPPPPAAVSDAAPADSTVPAVAAAAPPGSSVVVATSGPVAIDIPAIGVRSPLQHLGLTAERTLVVPAPGPMYDVAVWYEYSSTPGSPGPAIILGHIDSAANGPSVFFDLGDLEPGDEVAVTRADGTVAIFRVDSLGQYPKDEFPTDLVYGATDAPTLRLITCGGSFDDASGHYLDNLVVFASLVRMA